MWRKLIPRQRSAARRQLNLRQAGPGASWLLAAALFVAGCGPRQAAPPAAPSHGTVVVDTVASAALGTRKQLVVYLPPSYGTERSRRYPVAYYLHGAWGGEWDWVRAGRIDAAMDSLIAAGAPEMIIVMPDGDDGWYTTGSIIGRYEACQRAPRAGEAAESYCVPWSRYDDYVARDIVRHVDASYRTLASSAHRGIGGLSMGGYGAITLALAYPDVFSAAASHSGTLSILLAGTDSATGEARIAEDDAALRGWWGDRVWTLLEPAFGRDPSGWRARDPATLVRRLAARGGRMPALWIDVGTGDRYLGQSRHFASSLRAAGVPFEYAEHPGGHDWTYWRTHVPGSLEWIGRHIGPR